MITLDQKMPAEIADEVASRVRSRRKELKLTQSQLASKAGMSLASYKRFEQTGAIAFESLIRIGLALGREGDFDGLFAQRAYSSIEEVINESPRANRP